MDTNTLVLLLVIIFAAVVITGFLFYRQSARARILGPGGVGVEFEGKGRDPAAAGPQPPAAPGSVTMEDVDSGGNVRAAAKTGGDVGLKGISAAGDVTATTQPPPAPKAPPPPPGAAQP